MNTLHLRSILLNLQRRLSDHDRERLHFYLKNEVPRSIGDDSTLSGNLKLMDSLFDQAKISEQDFTFLIDAFKQIQCFDAVKLLIEHQRRMLLGGLNYSTQSLASILPPIISQFIDENDEYDNISTENLIMRHMSSTENNNNINTSVNHNINISSIINNMNTENNISSPLQSRQNQLFKTFLLKNKYSIIIFMLFTFTLGVLIVLLIVKTNDIHRLKGDLNKREDFILKIHNEINCTANDSNSILLLEKNEIIQQLTQQITELHNQRFHIKVGRIFGGIGGTYFDDSSILNFTNFYFLNGLITSNGTNRIDACQFIYTSSYDNESRIESSIHGNFGNKINPAVRFDLDHDEKINSVQVKMLTVTITIDNTQNQTREIVRDWRFFTTKGRSFPSNNSSTGNVRNEQFDGYILGHVTGRAAQSIDQLQFFWYRIIK